VRDLSPALVNGEVGKDVFAAPLAGPLQDDSCVRHNLLGNADQRAVGAALALMTLPRRHALDLLHPSPRRPRTIRESP
jgi:hypothetical protein